MFEFFCFKTDYAVPDERPKGLYLKTFAIAAWSFCPTTWELMLLHYLPWISETFVSLWWQWVRFSAHQGFFLVLFACLYGYLYLPLVIWICLSVFWLFNPATFVLKVGDEICRVSPSPFGRSHRDVWNTRMYARSMSITLTAFHKDGLIC